MSKTTSAFDSVTLKVLWDRLVSIVWPPNTASRRVAEKVHARMREFVWEKTGTLECLFETRRSDLPQVQARRMDQDPRGGR